MNRKLIFIGLAVLLLGCKDDPSSVKDPGIGTGVNEEPCPGTPTVTYGGKIYNTVKIGDQCWLKENLDIGLMISRTTTSDNQTDNGIIEKFCFDNLESNCTAYGGLYQWNEIMQYLTTEGSQGICPPGWHIPTRAEFEQLIKSAGVGSDVLKAIGQGTGTNTSGFTGLFAGHRDHNDGLSHGLGEDAIFWSSTSLGSGADCIDLYYFNNQVFFTNYHVDHGFSLRCIKD